MTNNNPWKTGEWITEPQNVIHEDGSLEIVTQKGPDFWRETYYGFTRDNGHFLGLKAPASFTAQVHIQGEFEELYDQAGIMVRIDAQHWIKAGIEMSDGRPMASSVLTNPQSDWATAVFEGSEKDFWMRVTVQDAVVRVQISTDGKKWPLLRLAPFPKAESYLVGPMACTPEREGLKVRFSEWSLGPPLGKDLHDLT